MQKEINKALRDRGVNRILNDFIGKPKKPNDIVVALAEIVQATGCLTSEVLPRVVGLYRSIVRHYQQGGYIEFVSEGDDGEVRKRLKSPIKGGGGE